MTDKQPNVIGQERVNDNISALVDAGAAVRNAARDVAAKIAKERQQQQVQQPHEGKP